MEDSTRIIEERDIPEVDCLVAGFPGNGLIGRIASEQMISTLELEQVASLDCDDFPPYCGHIRWSSEKTCQIFCR